MALLGSRSIRELKVREESQQVQDLVPVLVTAHNTAGLLCALVSLRSDCRKEENFLLIEVGRGNRQQKRTRC